MSLSQPGERNEAAFDKCFLKCIAWSYSDEVWKLCNISILHVLLVQWNFICLWLSGRRNRSFVSLLDATTRVSRKLFIWLDELDHFRPFEAPIDEKGTSIPWWSHSVAAANLCTCCTSSSMFITKQANFGEPAVIPSDQSMHPLPLPRRTVQSLNIAARSAQLSTLPHKLNF